MKQKIRNLIKEGKLVIGYERVDKMLSRGESIKEIVIANNAKDSFVKNIKKKAGISGIDVKELNMNNEELGIICKKPFRISVLGIKK